MIAPAVRPPGGGASPPGLDCAAARAERTFILALVFLRVGGLVEVASVVALDWRRYPSVVPVLALVAALAIESVILAWACWRSGRVRGAWIGGDVAFLIAALVIGARLTAPADGHTWVYFVYPFSVITCFAIGIAFARLPMVFAVTAALAGGYALTAILIHRDPLWNVMPNAVTYFANTAVAWAVARELRKSARSVDAAQADAIARAEDLARERERARHARILHDHVLQTLESLIRHRSIADPEVHSHVAAEAAWLRALVEGAPVDEPGDILSRLQGLIRQRTADGLRVEFNNAQLLQQKQIRRHLPRQVSDAVVDAVQEALTNVTKHAGVNTATMRVTATDGELTVSVLDHGIGFDPQRAHRGIGLENSITGRISEIGGTVRIDSDLGAGTYVELTVPVTVKDDGRRGNP